MKSKKDRLAFFAFSHELLIDFLAFLGKVADSNDFGSFISFTHQHNRAIILVNRIVYSCAILHLCTILYPTRLLPSLLFGVFYLGSMV